MPLRSEVPAGRGPDPAGFRFNLDDALARLSEPHQPIPRFKWSAVTPSRPIWRRRTDCATTRRRRTQRRSRDRCTPQARGRWPPSAGRRAEPDVTRLDVPRSGARESARSPNRPSIRCPRSARRPRSAPPATAHWSTVRPRHARAAAPPRLAVGGCLRRRSGAAAAAPMIVTGSDAFAAGVSGFSPDSDYAPTPDVLSSRPRRRRSAATARLRPGRRTADGDMMTSTASATPRPSGHAAAAKGSQEAQAPSLRQGGPGPASLLAGLVGGALMFGRDYLFPEDWSKDVVPAVDALQLSSGLEFADPVPVNTLPEAEYAVKVAGVHLRPDAQCRVDDVDAALAGPRSRRRRADRRVGERGRQRLVCRRSTTRPTDRSTAVPPRTGPGARRCDAQMRWRPRWSTNWRLTRPLRRRRDRSGRRRRLATASLAQLAVDRPRRRARRRPVHDRTRTGRHSARSRCRWRIG